MTLRVGRLIESHSAAGPVFGAALRSSAKSDMPLAASVASKLPIGDGPTVNVCMPPFIDMARNEPWWNTKPNVTNSLPYIFRSTAPMLSSGPGWLGLSGPFMTWKLCADRTILALFD